MEGRLWLKYGRASIAFVIEKRVSLSKCSSTIIRDGVLVCRVLFVPRTVGRSFVVDEEVTQVPDFLMFSTMVRVVEALGID
ncbi:17620_t:CDS:2, partial [Cetraspora pellucida]